MWHKLYALACACENFLCLITLHCKFVTCFQLLVLDCVLLLVVLCAVYQTLCVLR